MTNNAPGILDFPFLSAPPDIGGARFLRVSSTGDLLGAAAIAEEWPGIKGLWADLPGLHLSELDTACFPAKLPLTLYLGGAGNFMAYSEKLPALKKPGILVFLPAGRQAFTDLRILSSLGVRCGVLFGAEAPDWEALTDLLYYATYAKAPHAAIEPFAYAHTSYKGPDSQVNLSGAYFRHSGARLEAGAEAFCSLTPCSACPSWRVCGGAFALYRGVDGPTPCRSFAAALLETAEYCNVKNNI